MFDAFFTLLGERPPEKITVRDVCTLAKVNRSTFYAHFLDIFDLADQAEQSLHLQAEAQFREMLAAKNHSGEEYISVLLKCIKRNPLYFGLAFRHRQSFPLGPGREEILQRLILPRCAMLGITDEAEINTRFIFFQAGFTYALKAWLDGGCKESMVRMTGYLQRCIDDFLPRAEPQTVEIEVKKRPLYPHTGCSGRFSSIFAFLIKRKQNSNDTETKPWYSIIVG